VQCRCWRRTRRSRRIGPRRGPRKTSERYACHSRNVCNRFFNKADPASLVSYFPRPTLPRTANRSLAGGTTAAGARPAVSTSAAGGYGHFVPSTRFVVQLHDASTLHFDLHI
jgi:hypothetical protein